MAWFLEILNDFHNEVGQSNPLSTSADNYLNHHQNKL